MKRAGALWPCIVERGNLLLAFHRAARGKRRKCDVRRFAEDLDGNLDRLRTGLIERTFVVGRFHSFDVFEPKRRTIHAAGFPERVFHHALMNLCEPVLERHLVFHTYACRIAKGRLKAISAAEKNARSGKGAWYLKLDIRKYFESIPHDPLLAGVRRLFKDPDALYWFERIIRSHRAAEGRGLPIGSLTSQHLANFYLSKLDRFCQARKGVIGYVRYMDDFVLWAKEKETLLVAGRAIESFASLELDLGLKHPPSPQRVALGMDFLGFRVFRGHTRLSRRSKVRYRRKLTLVGRLVEDGRVTEAEAQQRLTALTAFTLPAFSWSFRSRTFQEFRSAAIGHEPGEPWRQLEQQRHQHAGLEPQQQQSGQPQQQQRVSPGPQLRPNPPDGAIRQNQGTEPAAVPIPDKRDEKQPTPARAGRSVDAGSNARAGGYFQ